MSFNIVYPITMTIDASSFKDAVKKYVKTSYDMNIQSLIITDQYRYMKAKLNYSNNGSSNRVGISLYPTVWPLRVNKDGRIDTDLWPLTPQVTYDTKEYPATTYITGAPVVPIVPKIVPLVTNPIVSPVDVPLTSPLIVNGFPMLSNWT